MINILTASQMKLTEKYTIENIGIPSLVLMERAALIAFNTIMTRNPNKVAILAGRGNNGGDGIALARMLYSAGVNTDLLIVGNPDKTTSENQSQQHAFQMLGGNIKTNLSELSDNNNSKYDVIVDALLGIGISRDLTSDYLNAVNYINESNSYIYSLDIPTGIHTDTGIVLGAAVKANETICFSEIKLGLLLNDGPVYSGKLTCCDVGIIKSDKSLNEESIKAITISDIPQLIPKRTPIGHKGSFGKILIIAGSSSMAGAALLSSKASFAAGAGMVKLISPSINKEAILANLPELMYSDADNINEEELSRDINWCDIVIIGPGLSTDSRATAITEYIFKNTDKTLIADADAINILSNNMEWLIERKNKNLTTILTPHPGEFKRLFKDKTDAPKLAQEYGCIIVAKNAKTIITDGSSTFINMTGNSGMAVAGSGDVLTGILASIIFNTKNLIIGAALSVYLHGAAGDLASKNKSEYSMTASDIIGSLGELL